MNPIIDAVKDLLLLSEDELTEVLLQDKYNKQNLRELVRRSLKEVKEYKEAFQYQLKLNEEGQRLMENMQGQIAEYRKESSRF